MAGSEQSWAAVASFEREVWPRGKPCGNANAPAKRCRPAGPQRGAAGVRGTSRPCNRFEMASRGSKPVGVQWVVRPYKARSPTRNRPCCPRSTDGEVRKCIPHDKIHKLHGGWIWVLVFRITQGLSQACIVPGMHTFLGKWTPLRERSRLSAWAYGGQALGPVLGLPLTGFIASSPLGWPGVFRFYGVLAALVGTLIWYMTADTPAKHPRITLAEKLYIESDIGPTDDSRKPKTVPWRRILTHRGMWAIVIGHIGQTWGQLTLYSEVPAFMDKVMGVNIKANGLLSALPFLVMWFTNFFFSWAADKLIVKKIFSVTQTRKLANSLGSIPAAVGLVVLAFVPKELVIVECVLVILCGFKVASHVGVYVNHIDISPNFSGTMMSLSNFMSNLCGSLAPIVAGFILTDVTSEYLWRQVFFVAAGMYFFTNLLYIILGTGERADWNDPKQEQDAENVKEYSPMLKMEKT
ncbi:Putative inorganic phosphate cotransporter [Papilio machaon]|uniref:Putative inorganic phosphate cotransporter n=1 Tax=Papilio machaon TaxID=76193 RepID=A0A194RFB1_PAPMA|nr:Putative inorganic phosphate cotransporter [Papilio machaon]